MRADRLVATLLLMQTRGRITAAELAAELEVSVATARRDLEALSSAGIPVYPQPGRHGGWQLVGGARTDLSGLSAPEARALFLLAGPASASSAAQGDAKTALRKLLRALPETFRDEAQAAAEATLIDPSRWGEHGRDQPDDVRRLQDAVVRTRRIRFTYNEKEREADPWGVIDKDGVWYLLAGTGRGQRTFRLDRMSALNETGQTFERPDGFTLDEAWARVVGTIEERRSSTWATVLIPERFLWVLRDHFGRHCHPDEEVRPDGRVRVTVGAPTARDIARTLSGWGAAVEVTEPSSVRTELARIGSELTALYATP
ncbi:putative DNA-binding transcriptional regulator YafY [Actinoplanes lutulentus]|uniref:Putative DNA-binding transcriptional regulator YafY n=1 Tax=Actinoplanes lutulentus TaxID=1287878 RepID=A0A327Z9J9_9ACTN|nr:YafY family protein [Actinoplanes lutulentus]MBB2946724.1 putative DNA-binding transcriptional regulator YafY [Actinoplanes lutulentus]RAK35616.1 putative DNA-binding transcriptional regulator YafY [Actinoplanes lutulentus]